MANVYKCGDTWWVRFRYDGQQIRRPPKTTKKAEARVVLHRLMDEYRNTGGKIVTCYRLTQASKEFLEGSSRASTLEAYRFYNRTTLRLLDHLHLDETDRMTWASSSRPGSAPASPTPRSSVICRS